MDLLLVLAGGEARIYMKNLIFSDLPQVPELSVIAVMFQ
jgi:hypothetical protein